MPPKQADRQTRRSGPAYNAAISLGTNIAAGFVLFGGLGFILDRRRGGGYFWTVCGLLLAVVYLGYEVWKLIRRLDAEERAQQGNRGHQEN